MRAGLAFVAAVIGAGLALRGIVVPALIFFVAAAALAVWRAATFRRAKP
jgi:mannose/fructose/N-acetylgalactosamine-specific phosphotransferase system component IID